VIHQEKRCEEILNSLVDIFSDNNKIFQITFYSKRSIKVSIFKDNEIISRWYKNSFDKILISLKDYIEKNNIN
jgi:hypothetical protein